MQNLKFHQGDVIGASVEKLPTKVFPIKNKPIALGEHSGHMHIITGDVELFELLGKIYAVVGYSGARLQHVHQNNFHNDWKNRDELPVADHKNILLPKGNYEFWIQKSYNPFENIMEDVED